MDSGMPPFDQSNRDALRRGLRDLLLPVCRQWRAAVLCFVAVMSGVTLAISVTPRRYESKMKILVKRERLDPLLSPQLASPSQVRLDVTETELNSTAELLRSRDLLEAVAVASNLLTAGTNEPTRGPFERNGTIAGVVKALERDLTIRPLKRTTLIEVRYTSTDPKLAARVLSNLARLYLEKHLAVNRPSGAYEFFTTQVDYFHATLQRAEARLKDFSTQHRVVSASSEGNAVLQRIADFEAALQEAQGGVAETTRRLREIRRQMASTPARVTTAIRTSQNAQFVRELGAKALDLEVKLTDLSGKFTATYPSVVALQKQIDQTRAALAEVERAPITDETTDRDPTHQWLESEAARVRVEHEAFIARAESLSQTIAIYRARASELNAKGTMQQSLTRDVKTAEDNYLLYQRKQEETRISDAMDQRRIANVVVAEAPIPATLPNDDQRRGMLILFGSGVALIVSFALAFALEFLIPRVRTAQDLRSLLNLPEAFTVTTTARRS
jgi:uncharacterized protein involved in exopolysaccharide biosynthesis